MNKNKNQLRVEKTIESCPVDTERLQQLVDWIFESEKQQHPWKVTLIFVDDEYITDLNRRFFDKDQPTDVISFNLTDSVDAPEGEIYISVDTAQENAPKFNADLTEELYRLVAHGTLHLLNYDDASRAEKAIMTELENKALEALNFN